MPEWAPHVRARLASIRRSPTREAEIVDELSQHLDDRYQASLSSRPRFRALSQVPACRSRGTARTASGGSRASRLDTPRGIDTLVGLAAG